MMTLRIDSLATGFRHRNRQGTVNLKYRLVCQALGGRMLEGNSFDLIPPLACYSQELDIITLANGVLTVRVDANN